jgi:hypothetical protein
MKRTLLVTATLLFVLGLRGTPIRAQEAAEAAAGAVRTETSASPPYYSDAATEQMTAAEAEKRSRPPRKFFDVYYGSVSTDSGNVSTSTQNECFIFCGPVYYGSRQVDYEPSSAFGFRFGTWFDKYPALGVAGDFSYLTADAPGVRVWYLPMTFEFLVRYRMLATDAVPDGRLQLYGGPMLSLVVGDVEVNGVGGSASDLGLGALFGVAWHFPSFALFGEYRFFETSLAYDSSDDWISFGQSTASADLNTNQLLLGVSFKY